MTGRFARMMIIILAVTAGIMPGGAAWAEPSPTDIQTAMQALHAIRQNWPSWLVNGLSVMKWPS